MRDDDLQAFKCAIHEVLDERNRIEAERHHRDHEWIEAQIRKADARARAWEKVCEAATQWAVGALLASMIGYLGIHLFGHK